MFREGRVFPAEQVGRRVESGEAEPAYRTVAIPRQLVEHLERVVAKFPDLGFRSHSEFILHATRDFVFRVEERALRIGELGLAEVKPERPMRDLRKAQTRRRPQE